MFCFNFFSEEKILEKKVLKYIKSQQCLSLNSNIYR